MISSRPVGPQQLFLSLRDRIEQGLYAPGSWLPAEREMAQEFGLDRSAVRRVLLQLENEGLIVREAGKRPWVRDRRALSQNSISAETRRPADAGLRTVVAILPQHPIYPASLAILHGINAALRSTGGPFRLQIIDTHDSSESRETSLEKQALESVVRERIDGVILWHMGGAETLPLLQDLEGRGIPVVFVDRHPPGLVCDFVGGDNRGGIEAAVDYLRRLGHRRIAHLTDDEQTTAVLERLAAYTEAMLASDGPPRREWVCQVSHAETTNVAPAFDHYFGLPEPPTALVAMNDSLAHYFITECERRGKSVPGDISVIGFDDLEGHSPRPALLTTLHQPFDQMGRRATTLLLKRLAGPQAQREAKQHIILPSLLVERSTCRPLQ